MMDRLSWTRGALMDELTGKLVGDWRMRGILVADV
jgi:hypothetical protein